ncbi:MAG: family 10 glycosylhydrolase [Chitinophagaceae bacterium]|nr:family 10 glycosylhydrolase [Chitinophagaceae bacterium]
MRHFSSISTLLLASLLLNSCAFFNKINDKVFPYKATTVEEITQAPAVKPKAPVKAPNEEVVKPKPTAAATKQTTPPVQKTPYKPFVSPLREFRAAWIATVANINWPSKPGLSTEEQKAEALSILNYLQENKFNAVIFQVRPQADALYKSDIEPWSYFLISAAGLLSRPTRSGSTC